MAGNHETNTILGANRWDLWFEHPSSRVGRGPVASGAQTMRSRHGLLTNDSLIVAAMDEYGIDSLASRDDDFDHVSGLTVYKPTDI